MGNDGRDKTKKIFRITGSVVLCFGFATGFIAPWIINGTDLVYSHFLLIPVFMFMGFAFMLSGIFMMVFGFGKKRVEPPSSFHYDSGKNTGTGQSTIICAGCGEANSPENVFCSNCGDML